MNCHSATPSTSTVTQATPTAADVKYVASESSNTRETCECAKAKSTGATGAIVPPSTGMAGHLMKWSRLLRRMSLLLSASDLVEEPEMSWCFPEWWYRIKPWLWSQIPHKYQMGFPGLPWHHVSQFCRRCER